MFRQNGFCLFLIIIGILKFVKLASDADEDRLNKVIACMNLNKAMIHYDTDYIDQVMNFVEGKERTQLVEDYARKSILNCFSKISMTKTAEFAKKKKFENINPFADDNKAILNMRNYKEKYSENASILKRDEERLFKLLKDIPMEITSYETLIDEKMKQRDSEKEKAQKERIAKIQEEERRQKAHQEKLDQTDETAVMGDINLSFFKRIGKSTQILIGCGFIAIIFVGLYLCLQSLQNKNSNKKKNKNK